MRIVLNLEKKQLENIIKWFDDQLSIYDNDDPDYIVELYTQLRQKEKCPLCKKSGGLHDSCVENWSTDYDKAKKGIEQIGK